MRLGAAAGLILGLVLIGCTSSSTVEAPDSSVPSPAQSEPPSSVPTSDIQFLLRDTYMVGERIPVRIENVGDVAYRYQFIYQACFLLPRLRGTRVHHPAGHSLRHSLRDRDSTGGNRAALHVGSRRVHQGQLGLLESQATRSWHLRDSRCLPPCQQGAYRAGSRHLRDPG
jgi:hypothetical protein